MMLDPFLENRAGLAQEVAPMRALWRAVLLQALREARGNIRTTTGAYDERTKGFEQRRANDWIGSREVCDLAGLTLSEAEVRAVVNGPKGELLVRRPGQHS